MPVISKIFEKFLDQQIEDFSDILPPKLGGFRKGRSTQNALLNLLKNWQKYLDKSGVVGTVLMEGIRLSRHTIVFLMISFSGNFQLTALMNLR